MPNTFRVRKKIVITESENLDKATSNQDFIEGIAVEVEQ